VLAGCDPATRVPACPDWDAADLVWHLAGVQLFWAKVVRHRPASPDDPVLADEPAAQRPDGYAELLETFDDFSHALVTELERADPAAPAWHWSPEQTTSLSQSPKKSRSSIRASPYWLCFCLRARPLLS
jgi:uncharacterized protein (TIGR03083 family)